MTIVLGGAGVGPVEESREAVRLLSDRFVSETAAAERSGDEIIPELERAIFTETVREVEADGEAERGAGSGLIHLLPRRLWYAWPVAWRGPESPSSSREKASFLLSVFVRDSLFAPSRRGSLGGRGSKSRPNSDASTVSRRPP